MKPFCVVMISLAALCSGCHTNKKNTVNDAGAGDTGVGDTGVGDTGVGDTGVGDTGVGVDLASFCNEYCAWLQNCFPTDYEGTCVEDCRDEYGYSDAECLPYEIAMDRCVMEPPCPRNEAEVESRYGPCSPEEVPSACDYLVEEDCCQASDPCGYADDGDCDCEGQAWDAADCAA